VPRFTRNSGIVPASVMALMIITVEHSVSAVNSHGPLLFTVSRVILSIYLYITK
jgi:hypothetical protein